MTACSLVRREHWERLHINCLLPFPSFKTNECFRLKQNGSLLITVLATLPLFPYDLYLGFWEVER